MLATPQISEGLPLLIAVALGTLALGVLLCYSGYRLYRQSHHALAGAGPQRCPQCGREIAGLRAKFCPECGQAMAVEASAATATLPLASSATLGSRVLLVAGIVLVLAGLFLAMVFGGVMAGSW